MKAFAFIFPGQGAQTVGMGKELADAFPAARTVFEAVDDALGEKLSDLIWYGPEEDLTLTANTQPALMAVSVAAMRALESEFGIGVDRAAFVAGHSLGEYSALAAAGALDLADTARLLRLRGSAMQEAVPPGEGAMAALLGAEMDVAEAVTAAGREVGACDIANDNAPGQVVISGSKAAVEKAVAAAEEAGVKKAVMLAVSAPFHCSLMQPAQEKMAQALKDVQIQKPATKLVANVTAQPCEDTEAIRQQLIDQVTGRVRWRESVAWMADSDGGAIEMTAEAGAGRVLTTMNKRISRSLKGLPLGSPAELEAFASAINSAE